MLRIPSLESGIYALGHLEFANSVEDQNAGLRPGLIEVKTFLKYERKLRNLQLQESRLSRRREKELAELRTLQETRKAVGSQPASPTKNGFVFSTGDLAQANAEWMPALRRIPASTSFRVFK